MPPLKIKDVIPNDDRKMINKGGKRLVINWNMEN